MASFFSFLEKSEIGCLCSAMRLEWNAGGWFGGQIGGTVWILVAALLSALRDISTGLSLLAIFAVPNMVGYLLWRRRNVSCYRATQTLIGAMGISGLLAIYALDRGHLWREIQVGGVVSVGSAYVMVALVIAILMLIFYVRFGRGENGSAS